MSRTVDNGTLLGRKLRAVNIFQFLQLSLIHNVMIKAISPQILTFEVKVLS